MDPAKPSLELVRSVTDERVLRALMEHRRLTRAELAAEIGISKPTAGESVRRLAERGLIGDTGERTPGGRGRGRVGSYYALVPAAGTALAVSIAPEGIVAELVDPYGEIVARAEQAARPAEVADALQAVTAAACHPAACHPAARQPRLAVVSAADPVDRATGRLVQLPDTPFLVGALDPVTILAPHVDGPVVVDNDVNWAAQAERDAQGVEAPSDLAYLFLGEGVGCAIVGDGEVRRGYTGLAGEIAHLITEGVGGHAVPLIEVFGELGLRRASSTAIDVERLLSACDDVAQPAIRHALARALSGVVAAVVALTDPERIIIGGSWGPAILDDLRAAVARTARPVSLQLATVTGEPSLAGARAEALRRLRASIVASA